MTPSSRPHTMSIGGATYDLFVRTGHGLIHHCQNETSFALPLGSKIRVENVIETCGGGASNTSVGLARLGCNAGFCGVVGSDQWGVKLLENLQHEKVDTRCATVVEGEISSFSIILSAGSGERVILYEPGTNAHLHDAVFDRESVGQVEWVYLNHIQEHSCVIQDDIIDMLATDEKPRFTWNPGGYQIEAGIDEPNNRALLSHTDLVLLNKEEAFAFTRTESVESAMQTLLAIGVKNICITHGKEGADATDGTRLCHCPVIEDTQTIDTTGAGDAFGIGATWALLHGEDLSEALRAGTINAASVVGAIGAQAGLLTEKELQKRMQEFTLDIDIRPF